MSGELYRELRSALVNDEPVVLATVTGVRGEATGLTPLGAKLVVRPDGRSSGTLGDPELDRVVERDALAALDRGVTVDAPLRPARRGPPRRGRRSSSRSSPRRARLIIFGAVDFTRALVEVGKVLGFAVTVCDAAPGVRHAGPLPAGRRGRRRLAGPLPRPRRRRARPA